MKEKIAKIVEKYSFLLKDPLLTDDDFKRTVEYMADEVGMVYVNELTRNTDH